MANITSPALLYYSVFNFSFSSGNSHHSPLEGYLPYSLAEWMCSSFLLLKKLFWYRKLSAQYNHKDFFWWWEQWQLLLLFTVIIHCWKRPYRWGGACWALPPRETPRHRDTNHWEISITCSVGAPSPRSSQIPNSLPHANLKWKEQSHFFPHWDLKQAHQPWRSSFLPATKVGGVRETGKWFDCAIAVGLAALCCWRPFCLQMIFGVSCTTPVQKQRGICLCADVYVNVHVKTDFNLVFVVGATA